MEAARCRKKMIQSKEQQRSQMNFVNECLRRTTDRRRLAAAGKGWRGSDTNGAKSHARWLVFPRLSSVARVRLELSEHTTSRAAHTLPLLLMMADPVNKGSVVAAIYGSVLITYGSMC